MPLPVTLDIQALQSPAHAERGIGRYVASHAGVLLAAGAPIARCTLNPLLDAPPTLPYSIQRSGTVAWSTERVFAAVEADGPFLHHIMSPFEDVRPVDGLIGRPAFGRASAIAVTVYDVIPYVMHEYQRSWWSRQFLRRRAELLRAADVVCTVSRHAAEESIEVLGLDPDRVTVIGSGLDPIFVPGGPDDTLWRDALPEIQRSFIMTVTGDDPRKQPLGLVDAYAALPRDMREEYQLVVVCTLEPHTKEYWRSYAARAGLRPNDVVFTGYIDDMLLRSLYRRASLFVFNSRHEGFGLPVLEAAACGCVAINSDNSALREVLAEPAARFPTGDHDALVDLMQRALVDDDLRSTIRASSARAVQHHTWDNVLHRTLEAYARFDTRPTRRRSTPTTSSQARVALVGPFAPATSGVADYDERVAAALAPHSALDCFAEVDPPYERAITAGRRFSILAFDRTFSPANYDSIIYAMGNSRFHRVTFQRALRYPGIVWLHDACLAGVYLTSAGLYLPGVATEDIDFDAAEAFMRAALVRCTGSDRTWLGSDWWRPEAYVEAGVLMTEEILRSARAAIVSSEEARRLVEARAPAGLPVHVVPLAVPDASTFAGDAGADVSPPWIVTLGVVSTVKRIDDLIRAFALVRRDTAARLAIVGNIELAYANELHALARQLGVDDDVVITGFVPSSEYVQWLQRASILVQLRTHSVGEGSATVTDALSAARAVVTNVGSSSELPDGVVERVAVDVGVDALGALLRDLTVDKARRSRLEAAARSYATTHSFTDVARAVLDIAASVAEPQFPALLARTSA